MSKPDELFVDYYQHEIIIKHIFLVTSLCNDNGSCYMRYLTETFLMVAFFFDKIVNVT